MPQNMLAARKRMATVRQYFKERLAHLVDDPNEARQEISSRFPDLPSHSWYNLKSEFRKMISEAKANGGNGVLVEAQPEAVEEQVDDGSITIPADLDPEAKRIINTLISRHDTLATELRVKEAEVSAMRGQVITTSKRQTLLKKIVSDLMDQL